MLACWGNIAKNRLSDLQVRPGARITWLGGKNKFWGVLKNFNTSNPRVWTKKQRSSSQNLTKSRVKTKKKIFLSNYARIFTNSGVKTKKNLFISKMRKFPQIPEWNHKKKGLYYKICEKAVFSHEFWGDNPYLGSRRSQTVLKWHRACYFLWGTILAWGGRFIVWGGTSSDLGDTFSECPPWRRACCKFAAIYWTVTTAFLLKRYCSKSVLLKKWKPFEVIMRFL